MAWVPVAEPDIGETEVQFVMEAVKSGWISSHGKYIREFEEEFAAYSGVAQGISVCNGTAALHLALVALGVGPGDEVVVPALTFVATASAVKHAGATPVFVDIDEDTWCMSPEAFAEAIGPRTKAVIPVHLYGHPADMDRIVAIARAHDIYVVEDAAEAHGARIGDRRVGSFSDVACFSFFGNKTITTGEGGMCLTSNSEVAHRLRLLRDHAMSPEKRYWHEELGFNYRMTNLQAALGLAQLARLDEFVARKRQTALHYASLLAGVRGVVLPVERPGYMSTYWMFSVLIRPIEFGIDRDSLADQLRSSGIDTRPFFVPLPDLPPFREASGAREYPVARNVGAQGLNLPSSTKLEPEDVRMVAEAVVRHGRGDRV